MAVQRLLVLGGHVPLVGREVVLRPLLVQFGHDAVPGYLRDHRCCRDAGGHLVALPHRQARDAQPATGKPSVRTYAGVHSSFASARRIASMFDTCRPARSTSSGGTTTTDHAAAFRTTASYTRSRARGVS